MDSDNQIPVLICYVLEADVAENAGVVDQDVDATVALDGGLDDLVAILDAVVVGNCLAACGLDLLDDDICCLCYSC